jgi:phosphoglycerate dehydrogenase-like enzyme
MSDSDGRWHVLLPNESDIHPAGPDSLADIAAVSRYGDYEDRAALLADADRFDAIVERMFEVDEALLDAATNLKVVSKHGVGLDAIDVAAAHERGIVVCNAPGANANAVAEHALGLLFATRRSFRRYDRDVRAGEFDRGRYPASDLRGDTLGLLGCGDIGSAVAGLADAVGMDVIAHDPYLDAFPDDVTPVESRLELFERADAVSLHLPLNDGTAGLVGEDELAALAGELVNCARGGVVDEADLRAALSAGTVTAAGVDVFAEEPPGEDHPLFEYDNVVCTPHVGAYTDDALRAVSLAACENVRTVYEGGVPDSAVTPETMP